MIGIIIIIVINKLRDLLLNKFQSISQCPIFNIIFVYNAVVNRLCFTNNYIYYHYGNS